MEGELVENLPEPFCIWVDHSRKHNVTFERTANNRYVVDHTPSKLKLEVERGISNTTSADFFRKIREGLGIWLCLVEMIFTSTLPVR
jgi:hypothetical protein